MEVSYTAKATTDITCIAETDPEQWTGTDPDVPVRVRGVRTDGTVVIEGVIRLWVTEKPDLTHRPPTAFAIVLTVWGAPDLNTSRRSVMSLIKTVETLAQGPVGTAVDRRPPPDRHHRHTWHRLREGGRRCRHRPGPSRIRGRARAAGSASRPPSHAQADVRADRGQPAEAKDVRRRRRRPAHAGARARPPRSRHRPGRAAGPGRPARAGRHRGRRPAPGPETGETFRTEPKATTRADTVGWRGRRRLRGRGRGRRGARGPHPRRGSSAEVQPPLTPLAGCGGSCCADFSARRSWSSPASPTRGCRRSSRVLLFPWRQGADHLALGLSVAAGGLVLLTWAWLSLVRRCHR